MVPSRLELNSLFGSASAAPLIKVSLTLSLYVSPVQRMPAWSHTGTPPGFDGFCHLTDSSTSGSAAWISERSFASMPDRKSVVAGKSVSVSVELGGRRIIKKKRAQQSENKYTNN